MALYDYVLQLDLDSTEQMIKSFDPGSPAYIFNNDVSVNCLLLPERERAFFLLRKESEHLSRRFSAMRDIANTLQIEQWNTL